LTEQQRHDILQIRVVGGGPTGVEYAAELHDFVVTDVERMYPQLKGKIGITLYDVAPGILMSFDA
jgi:NADH dehydrogenase FAD-containing subunit